MLTFASIATIVCLFPSFPVSHGPNGPRAVAKQSFVLDAGEYRVTELVELSEKFLGRNYLMRTDSATCQPDSQMIKITKRLELDRNGCEEVVSQLLYHQDWIMTPLDASRGIYEWINLAGPRLQHVKRRSFYMSPDDVIARPSLYVHVTTTVAVKHLDAREMSKGLGQWVYGRPDLLQILTIGYKNNGTILIAGMAHQVSRMLLAIRQADENGANAPNRRASPMQNLQNQINQLRGQVKQLSGR